MKKAINFIVPFLYLIPVFMVLLHKTNYEPMRVLSPPYIFYVIMAGMGFTVIRMILNQAVKDENEKE